MPIGTTDAYAGPYLANGVTTAFPFTFQVLTGDQVSVILRDASGTDTTVSPSDYTVSLSGSSPSNGSVIFSTAPATGYSVYVLLEPEFTQDIEFADGAAWLAKPVNDGYDSAALRAQALKRDLNRTLVAPVGDSLGTVPLDRSGKYLMFDGSGQAALDTPENFAAPASEAAAQAAGYALALQVETAGGWYDSLESGAADTAPGEGFFVVYPDGRFVLAENVAGVGTARAEFQTTASSGYITPEAFGATGSGDEAAILLTAMNAANASNSVLRLRRGRTYSFSQLAIPDGTVIEMNGATLRHIPGLSTDQVSLAVGNDVQADRLRISTPGTETNTTFMTLGSRVDVRWLKLASDTNRTGSGIVATGDDVQIGRLLCRKIDRPIHFDNSAGGSPTTGSRIDFLDCTEFVRGFRATNCDGWTIGGFRMWGRSPNASYTAGHNGFLLTDSQDWEVGDGTILGSGEHAIRFSGENRAVQNGKFGHVRIDSCGGCAVKINPYSAYRTSNVEIAGINGIDVGDVTESGAGDNKELLRLSHCDKIRIGYAYADRRNEAYSGQYLLKVNDITDVWIGELGGNKSNAGIILDSGSDVGAPYRSAGPVKGLYIDSFSAILNGSTNAISVVMDTLEVSDVFINFDGASGWSGNVASFTGTPSLTGPMVLSGALAGAATPTFNNAPASANFRVNLMWAGRRIMGQASLVDGQYAGWQNVVGSAFDPGNTKGSQLIANAAGATAGAGNYGGAYEFTRAGSTRRGAAVALVQTGAAANNTGVEFDVGGGALGSDAVTPAMRITHERALAIVDGVTAPTTATGWAQIYVDSADGDLKIKFGDGTVKTIVVDS